MSKSCILVTGGTGYIGTHVVVELARAGYAVVIVDNLCNSSDKVLPRLETICGHAIPFVHADVRDRAALDRLFEQYPISAVMHFAGLKAVGESVANPLEYYANNVGGIVAVLQAMRAANIRRFVFSSSATVYGGPHTVPITEDFPLQTSNPYGRSKLICENILRDLLAAEPHWQIGILRYFNPVGAHASGLIGEASNGIPSNLMPFLTQVAVGKRAHLSIYGNDYPTPDGTGVRDYIHVTDLAEGHVAALAYMENHRQSLTVNLGSGQGVSVLSILHAFEKATGLTIPHQFVARREGDVASYYADASLAKKLLGWHTRHDIGSICRDAWRWQSMNPDGY